MNRIALDNMCPTRYFLCMLIRQSNSQAVIIEVDFTAVPLVRRPNKRALRGRRLVLVDIENVVGGAAMTAATARWARDVVDAALSVAEGEQVVIATSHAGLLSTCSAWPAARVKVRSGKNGADLELLDVLVTERLAERFEEVVVVSGDGIFADAIAALASKGVLVTVASWHRSLSARLRLAAGATVYLDNVSARMMRASA